METQYSPENTTDENKVTDNSQARNNDIERRGGKDKRTKRNGENAHWVPPNSHTIETNRGNTELFRKGRKTAH
jgi:hypothetical protein